MAGLRSLVFLLVAACWFFTLINAAAVHNLIFDNESENVNDNYNNDRESESHLVFPESFRTRRSIDSESETRSCHSTTPCGWAVYTPFQRRVDYFMKNTCNCPATFKCVRTDDDLSVSAYVYRCRTNISDTDIESPDSKDSN